MPTPERKCETCRNWRPYVGSKLLETTYAKCVSSRKPVQIQFSDILRGDPTLCGPDAIWWEPRPPQFEVLDDEPRALDWDDDPEDAV